MTKFNFQSISFALVLLFLVLIGKSEGVAEPKEATGRREDVFQSSLTAQVSAAPVKPDFAATETILNPAARAENSLISSEPGKTLILFADPEPSPKAPADIKVFSFAYLLKETGSPGAFLQKAGESRWPLASLTKLMTAVVASEKIAPEQKIVLSESAVQTEGVAGDFRPGEIFTNRDLIKAALAASSNDAAMAIAEFYGARDFVELMTLKAAHIGMKDTVFSDPTGLSILNQSTLNDLELLIEYILKNHPAVFEATRNNAEITELNSNKKRFVAANNKFAGRADFKGGKTGFTDHSKGNLISLFEIKGRQFLIIILGSDDRFGETEKIYGWLKSII